jgi:Flp pilus assembly protein TadG
MRREPERPGEATVAPGPLPPARRGRGERGGSLVEFALALPILLTIVFGIAEYGVAYNNYVSLRSGVRDGARQGVVGSLGADSACTHTGSTPSTDTKLLLCLTKSRIGTQAPAQVRFGIAFPDTGGYAVGNRMKVCAQYRLNSVTGYPAFAPMLNNRAMTSTVEMRIEQVRTGAGILAAYNETPLVGASNWCS